MALIVWAQKLELSVVLLPINAPDIGPMTSFTVDGGVHDLDL